MARQSSSALVESWNGVPQVASPAVVALTMTYCWPAITSVHVAQSCPVESLSMTRVSELVLLIWAGKPASSV